MSVPPGSPTPPDANVAANQPTPPHLAGGSAPEDGNGFWDNDFNKLLVVVGGILVACMLLAVMAVTAAVGARALTGDQDNHHKMSRSDRNGDGPNRQGGRGQRGFGEPGDDSGLGALGGLGGLRGSLDMFSKFQHGDVVVTGANGQPETKRIARGVISAVTAASVSITSTDNFVSTYAVAEATKITIDGKSGGATALAVGHNAFAMGTVVGAAATAEVITATTP